MFKKSIMAAAIFSMSVGAWAAEAPMRLHSTQNETFIMSVDNSLPGDAWIVTFAVKGQVDSKINGKRWDLFGQRQLVDCADLTYVVAEGIYMYKGKIVHRFDNLDTGKAHWKAADTNTDNSRRVIEFCANTKIYGD